MAQRKGFPLGAPPDEAPPLPAALQRFAVRVRFRKGETVAYKGQPVQYVYLVQSGHVVLQTEYASGNYFSYAHIRASRYIGDLEVLSGQMPFVGTLIASEDTCALRFPAEEFRACLLADRDFLLDVVHQMAHALYDTSLHRGHDHYYASRQRLSRLILRYCGIFPVVGDAPVRIDVTRQQMASELGVNVKTVNRGVAELAAAGLVAIERGKMTVAPRQRDALAATLEDDED